MQNDKEMRQAKSIYFTFIMVLVIAVYSKTVSAQYIQIVDQNLKNELLAYPTYSSCIVGNQIDTLCIQAALQQSPLDFLNLEYKGISDVSPIAYFEGLESISLLGNNISSLPIRLPQSLETLNVGSNNLSNLDLLPPNLRILKAANNNLDSISNLPLPLTLIELGNNSLNELPPLPQNLIQFDITGNNISILEDTIFGPLTLFKAAGNKLTKLPHFMSTELTQVIANDNEIVSISNLPASLRIVNLNRNDIESLGDGPLPDSVRELRVRSNRIESIYPILPSRMRVLDIENNLISGLGPLPSTIQELYVDDNRLSCLPYLPPNLRYLEFFNGNSITCVPNYPTGLVFDFIRPAPGSYSYPICNEIDSDCPWSPRIEISSYLDENQNCVKDSFEQTSPSNVILYDSSWTRISQHLAVNKTIDLYGLNPGDYNLVLLSNSSTLGYSCALSPDTIHIVVDDTSVYEIEAIQSCGSSFDIGTAFQKVRLPGFQFFRFLPSLNSQLYFLAGDLSKALHENQKGCVSGVSGAVEVFIDGPVSYVGDYGNSPQPDSISSNYLRYDIDDFGAKDQTSQYTILLTPDSTAQSGELVCMSIKTSSDSLVGSDADTLNDSTGHCLPVLISYDPNIIIPYPEGEVVYPFKELINYTIFFQNTGDAPAVNVKIKDTLSNQFELSRFEILESSHPVDLSIRDSILTFHFQNIFLPDSASDSAGSIGFVSFRLPPIEVYPIGTEFKNRASIFFDYNDPIVTNTAMIRIVDTPSAISETPSQLKTKVYPNPNSGSFTIQHEEVNDGYWSLYDLRGALIEENQLESGKTTLDLNLPDGIFLLKIFSERGVATHKISVSN